MRSVASTAAGTGTTDVLSSTMSTYCYRNEMKELLSSSKTELLKELGAARKSGLLNEQILTFLNDTIEKGMSRIDEFVNGETPTDNEESEQQSSTRVSGLHSSKETSTTTNSDEIPPPPLPEEEKPMYIADFWPT